MTLTPGRKEPTAAGAACTVAGVGDQLATDQLDKV